MARKRIGVESTRACCPASRYAATSRPGLTLNPYRLATQDSRTSPFAWIFCATTSKPYPVSHEALDKALALSIIKSRFTALRGDMFDNAFKVLGIEPTTDGRVIRNAYVRLARIYHPDRFTGMPPDVRSEAERRMKQATAAYESLRAAKRTAAASAPVSKTRGKKDPWEEAHRARDAVVARRLEQERSRARWLLWEELERQARQRAAFEAEQVSIWVDPPDSPVRLPEAGEQPPEPVRSAFARRLEEARNGSSGALAPARHSR